MKQRRWLSMCLLSLAINCLAVLAFANPYIAPGDLALRHDIQLLADYGVIAGTVTSWPLSWGAIISDIEHYDDAAPLPDDVEGALDRVRARGPLDLLFCKEPLEALDCYDPVEFIDEATRRKRPVAKRRNHSKTLALQF